MTTFNIIEHLNGSVSLTRNVLNGEYLEIVLSPSLYNDLVLPSWLITSELYKLYRDQGLFVKSITYSHSGSHYLLRMSGDGLGIHYHFESDLWNHALNISEHTCHNAKMIPFNEHPSILIDKGCNLLIKTGRKILTLSGNDLAWLTDRNEFFIEVLMGRNDLMSVVLRDQPIVPGYLSDLNVIVKKLTGLVITKLTLNVLDESNLDIYDDEILLDCPDGTYPVNADETFSAEYAVATPITEVISECEITMSANDTEIYYRNVLAARLFVIGLSCPDLTRLNKESEALIQRKEFECEILTPPSMPGSLKIIDKVKTVTAGLTDIQVSNKYDLRKLEVYYGSRLLFNIGNMNISLDPISNPPIYKRLIGLFQTSNQPILSQQLDEVLFVNMEPELIYATDLEAIYKIAGHYFTRTCSEMPKIDTLAEIADVLKLNNGD